MALNAFNKDPDTTEDFGVDWTERLQGDQMLCRRHHCVIDWIVPNGLTEEDDMWMTKGGRRRKLSGRSCGTTYRVTGIASRRSTVRPLRRWSESSSPEE